MNTSWQLQDAKNKLSEVIDAALAHGPQIITRRGVNTAIVLSMTEYRKLLFYNQKFSKFLLESPLAGSELDVTRDQGLPRPDPML